MDKKEQVDGPICSLTKIVEKLGHNLLEVRVRSFQNILSKLQNGIITIDDLLYENTLYIYLLQFLNKNENVTEAIKLLGELAKFPFGAEKLIEIGGVEFFTHFRHDEQHKGKDYLLDIDNLLDKLFYLHVNVISSSDNNQQLDNQRVYNKINFDDNSIKYADMQSTKKDHYIETFSTFSSSHNTSNTLPNTDALSPSKMQTDFQVEIAEKTYGSLPTTFQFLSLSSGDRQILHATDNRLKSASPIIIKQSCDFFQEVILFDFPAEVFLQRPAIYRTFLSLLSIYKTHDINVTLNVLLCFTKLSEHLKVRLLNNSNGDLWQKERSYMFGQTVSISTSQSGSSNQGSSSDTRKSNRDQQELYENLESEDNFESSNFAEALMQEQISVADFALTLLLVITDLLKLHIENTKLFITICKLFRTLSDLLVLDNFFNIWSLEDSSSKRKAYDFITCLHKFEAFIEINSRTDASMDMNLHTKFLIAIKLMLHFISSGVPDEKVYEVMTDNLVILCHKVLTKVTYLNSLPLLRKNLVKTLLSSDQNFKKNYSNSLQLFDSMKYLDIFQQLLQQKIYNERLFEVMFLILPGLFLHAKKSFIEEVVNLCSISYLKKNLKKKSVKLFNLIINYKDETVREILYTSTIAVLKKSMSVSLVCEPLSTLYQHAMFLIRKNVFSIIICEDIHHDNQKISALATCVLYTILSSSLCMSVKMFKKLIEIISHFFVYLQAKLNTADKAITKLILSLFNQQKGIINIFGERSFLLKKDCVKGALRIMFLNSLKMRRKGFLLMIDYLKEFSKELSIQLNISVNVSQENMFVFEAQDCLFLNHNQYKNITSVDILRLWEIFSVETVADDIRYSAAEQLAIMLEDHTLHESIVPKNACIFIVDEIQKCLYNKNENPVPEKHVASLFRILRNFIAASKTIRHNLSSELHIYFYLFHYATLSEKNKNIQFEISFVLMYLLFEEILPPNNVSEKTMLSECIAKNYQLPTKFQIAFKDKYKENSWVEQGEYKFFLKVSCFHFCTWYSKDDDFNNEFKLSSKEKELQKLFSFKSYVEQLFAPLLSGFDRKIFIESVNHVKLLLYILDEPQINKEDYKTAQQNPSEVENYHVRNCNINIDKNQGISHTESMGVPFPYNPDIYHPNNILHMINSMLLDLFGKAQKHRAFITCPLATDDNLYFFSILSLFSVVAELKLFNFFDSLTTFLHSCNTSDIIIGKIITGDKVQHKRTVQEIIVTILKIFVYQSQHCGFPFSQTKLLSTQLSSVCNLIVALYNVLQISGSESHYDLPLMENVLALLAQLLTYQNWSLEIENGESVRSDLFNWMINIIKSFEVDRIGAAVSFMGKGIVKASIVCLCHLVHEIKASGTLCSLTNLAISKNSKNSIGLQWMSSLLLDRSIEVRWGGWLLTTELFSENCKIIVIEFQNQPGGIWAATIEVILNSEEAFVVRAQACALLCVLFKQLSIVSEEDCLWDSIVVQDTITKKKIIGSAAFVLLFDHFNLYNKISKMFANDFLYVSCNGVVDVSTSITQNDTLQTLDSKYSENLEVEGYSSSQSGSNECLSNKSSECLLNKFYDGCNSKAVNKSSEMEFSKKIFKSLLMKKSVINVTSGLVLLSSEDIINKVIDQNVLDAIFSNWNPIEFITESKFCQEPISKNVAKNLMQHLKIALANAGLVNALLSCNFLKAKNNLFKKILVDFRTVDKFFLLFSLSYRQIWELGDICMTVWHDVCITLGYLLVRFKEILPSLCLAENFQSLCGAFLFLVGMKTKTKLNKKCTDNLMKLLVIIFQLNEESLVFLDIKPIMIELVDMVNVMQIFILPSQNLCIGEYLCCILLHLYNHSLCSFQHLAKTALSSLFNVSKKAKVQALNEGFAEIFIEEIKDVLVKINICSIRDEQKVDEKKIDLFNQLVDCLHIVRNFAVHAHNVKSALIAGGIITHLFNVRIWSEFHPPLVDALLLLILVLSCRCQTAQAVLCSQTSLVGKHALDESSFIQYNLKMMEKLHKDILLANTKLIGRIGICFGILTNTINIPECRNILIKSGLFGLFINLYTASSSGNIHQRNVANTLLSDWLKFITSFSFFQDGAKVIWKVPGILPLLITIINGLCIKRRDYGLLILRNVVYVPAIKQSLSSNFELLSMVLEKLRCQSLKTKVIVSGFFWILVCGNQKAMNFLKKSNFKNYLLALKDDIDSGRTLAADGDLRCHDALKYSLAKTLELIG
ncbi:rotatin-like isoform X2 [Hydra vulgaris]|uniref:Rotatin-like isoform X2 n=1 Tax=Hydra vulgaris TaxID=6087 RepID=A0ABM4DNW9_HYDVU